MPHRSISSPSVRLSNSLAKPPVNATTQRASRPIQRGGIRREVLCPRREVLCPRCEVLCPRCEVLCPRCEVLCPRCEVLCPRCEVLCPRCEVLCPRREVLCPRREVLCPRREEAFSGCDGLRRLRGRRSRNLEARRFVAPPCSTRTAKQHSETCARV